MPTTVATWLRYAPPKPPAAASGSHVPLDAMRSLSFDKLFQSLVRLEMTILDRIIMFWFQSRRNRRKQIRRSYIFAHSVQQRIAGLAPKSAGFSFLTSSCAAFQIISSVISLYSRCCPVIGLTSFRYSAIHSFKVIFYLPPTSAMRDPLGAIIRALLL